MSGIQFLIAPDGFSLLGKAGKCRIKPYLEVHFHILFTVGEKIRSLFIAPFKDYY